MIKAVQCPQCGAGVSAPSKSASAERTCEYCGSVFRMQAAAPVERNGSEEHSYISSRHCPRCHHTTVETDINKSRIRACHHCGGVWVPYKALRSFSTLSGKAQKQLRKINRSRVRRQPRNTLSRHGAIRCPRCAGSMTQKVYSKGAGVIVDVCAKHGAWFDENELEIAHKHIAKRLGVSSGKGRKSNKKLRFKDTWEHGPVPQLLRALAEIVEDVLD